MILETVFSELDDPSVCAGDYSPGPAICSNLGYLGGRRSSLPITHSCYEFKRKKTKTYTQRQCPFTRREKQHTCNLPGGDGRMGKLLLNFCFHLIQVWHT